MNRRTKLRWRGVECVYGEPELEHVQGLARLAEERVISAEQAAAEWDFLQETLLAFDGAAFVDPATEGPDLYDDLLPIVVDGPFKIPADVAEKLAARRGMLPPP